MPEELDDPYNEPLEEVFQDALRDPDGLKGSLFERFQAIYADFLEFVAQGEGVEDTEQRVEEGLQELEAASVAAIRKADGEARRRVEDAHKRGYEAAASAAGVAASDLPDWSPDASGTDVNARAPFDGDIEDFVRSSLEEEVSYYKQDLKFIRKYVDEDSYAKATAQVLARGDDEVKQMLARRGIDLDDIDTDALLDEAADVFQNTKTMGSPDIRGILEEIDPQDLAARNPELFERIKAHGTDRLPRVMDEVAKDLAVQSPAVNAVSWTLSTRHGSLDSSPDSCDFLASQDAHGLGPGLYKPTHVPSHPHPNCECRVTARTLDPDEWGSDPIDTPSTPDVDEDAVRAVLEDVAQRMPADGRTVTDRHVERMQELVNEVTQEVHNNPRG
jgi:hypothetical protein